MSSIPQLFDLALIASRRKRALERFGREGEFLLAEAVTDLMDRLSMVKREFALCAEVGGHTGLMARALSTRAGTERVIRLEQFPALMAEEENGIVFDGEVLPLKPRSLDLVVSPLFLHWINDLPGALIQIRQSLVPDGLFLGSILGGESLQELRAAFLEAESELTGGATPRVAPLPNIKDMGALLQRAGFALPVVDQDRLTVRCDTMFALIEDLRRMGATNALVDRSRVPLRRSVLIRAAEIYAEKYSDPNGRLRATFQILSLSGWAPDKSQQQPLKPGSAKASLRSALGDKSDQMEN
ncbi:methyltransferase domain-containing protein [uncultured Cohaesibacter sp.]|uniref:methyltransferase domain-containing protein n=1 Tax=uncultured Cohaesibacter sp. TaxID=1002546 RepID=UPI0029C7B5F2|nr:methyltransferase domain-containing protein [uncultured Cohaesibacter sp.]